jgi:hypothetical protein
LLFQAFPSLKLKACYMSSFGYWHEQTNYILLYIAEMSIHRKKKPL